MRWICVYKERRRTGWIQNITVFNVYKPTNTSLSLLKNPSLWVPFQTIMLSPKCCLEFYTLCVGLGHTQSLLYKTAVESNYCRKWRVDSEPMSEHGPTLAFSQIRMRNGRTSSEHDRHDNVTCSKLGCRWWRCKKCARRHAARLKGTIAGTSHKTRVEAIRITILWIETAVECRMWNCAAAKRIDLHSSADTSKSIITHSHVFLTVMNLIRKLWQKDYCTC